MKRRLQAVTAGFLIVWATPSLATTCDQAVYKCKTEGNHKSENVAKCEAAGDHCKKTGDWIGPVTGKTFKLSR